MADCFAGKRQRSGTADASPGGVQVAVGHRQRPLGNRARLILIGVALAFLVAGALALWAWDKGAEERAVSKLPAEERAVLYRRELESLRSLCGGGPRSDA